VLIKNVRLLVVPIQTSKQHGKQWALSACNILIKRSSARAKLDSMNVTSTPFANQPTKLEITSVTVKSVIRNHQMGSSALHWWMSAAPACMNVTKMHFALTRQMGTDVFVMKDSLATGLVVKLVTIVPTLNATMVLYVLVG